MPSRTPLERLRARNEARRSAKGAIAPAEGRIVLQESDEAKIELIKGGTQVLVAIFGALGAIFSSIYKKRKLKP